MKWATGRYPARSMQRILPEMSSISGKLSRKNPISSGRADDSHEHSVTAMNPSGLRNRRHWVSPFSKPML